MGSITSIDLFCGCGGFSLGLKQADIKTLAAIDLDAKAIETYKANFSTDGARILEKDLTQFSPEELQSTIGTASVDLIVGGPPCQGFSHVRRVDGVNNVGPRFKDDPRRDLYKQFLRYVEHFKPKVFVMENVLGIKSAASGRYFATVQAEARDLGYRVHAQVVQAWEYGVPQKRRRQLFIGTKDSLPIFRPSLLTDQKSDYEITLGEAIMDLPPLVAGEGAETSDYDLAIRLKHTDIYGFRSYIFDVARVQDQFIEGGLTSHRARPHNETDINLFAQLNEGENSAQALASGKVTQWPYSMESFSDRYKRQHREDKSSTIVAHLAKDGLMFIHPTQDRSLTPREAARLQSFPDSFTFPVARTHQFRLIGNAVPPLVGKVVGRAVEKYLADSIGVSVERKYTAATDEMIRLLQDALVADAENKLRSVPSVEFATTWIAVCRLYPGLHPDSHSEHGSALAIDRPSPNELPTDLSDAFQEYYVTSGWPVRLVPLLAEAWRRYDKGLLGVDEFYFVPEWQRVESTAF